MKEIVYKSKMLSYFACVLTRLHHPGFQKEIKKRSELDLFDYKNIAKSLPKYYEEICTDNNCFGIGRCIRKYSGYKGSYVKGWIEHGYFYFDTVSSLASISFAKSILTFGSHREKVNVQYLPKKKCVKIGPYIHYADDYIDEETFKELKAKLGRVLLVFPMHSGTGQKVQYDIDELFKNVESVAGDFDTVLFSLFWTDINSEYVSQIESRGFKTVCSGHRFDPYFLSRQKTIIKLADVTLSNGLGTNLVYCTYLKKPHWLIRQKRTYASLNAIGDKHKTFQENNINKASVVELLYDIFKDYRNDLSEVQYDLCSQLFGFNDIKSPIEMLDLLSSL